MSCDFVTTHAHVDGVRGARKCSRWSWQSARISSPSPLSSLAHSRRNCSVNPTLAVFRDFKSGSSGGLMAAFFIQPPVFRGTSYNRHQA